MFPLHQFCCVQVWTLLFCVCFGANNSPLHFKTVLSGAVISAKLRAASITPRVPSASYAFTSPSLLCSSLSLLFFPDSHLPLPPRFPTGSWITMYQCSARSRLPDKIMFCLVVGNSGVMRPSRVWHWEQERERKAGDARDEGERRCVHCHMCSFGQLFVRKHINNM